MAKYYIKDEIIYSKELKDYHIPSSVLDLSIPTETKNHLINNKIIINSIEKLRKNEGKKIQLSSNIKNFENIKAIIVKNKDTNFDSTFSKPANDDYDFIEKTSQLDIIEGILSSPIIDILKELRMKIEYYVRKTKVVEEEKNAQLDEQIDIEKSKKKAEEKLKDEFVTENITPIEKEISKIDTQIKNSSLKSEKLEQEFDKMVKGNDMDSLRSKLDRELSKIEHSQENLKFDVKIMQSKISTIKDEIRLGKKRCVNPFLFVLTLGLIYWSNYSTCKHKILRLTSVINRKKEKILMLEQKEYNLKKKLEDELSCNNAKCLENNRNEEKLTLEIDNLKTKVHDKNSEKNKLQKELDKAINELKKFDVKISKLDVKIIELEVIKVEFEKYSTSNITDEFEKLSLDINNKFNDLKELKLNIEKQEIDFEGEWIVEV